MKIARPPVKANAANAIPTAAWTANSFWSCGAASDDGFADVVLVELVAVAVLIDEVADEEEALENIFWLVTVAVRPVTLVQPDPTELFIPATKLTAEHYDGVRVSLEVQPLAEAPSSLYLVEHPISSILHNLQKAALTDEVGRHCEVGDAEIAQTGLMHNRQQVGPIEWFVRRESGTE